MIYVTGDMHGDENRLFDKGFSKLKRNDVLIVLGDFGFLWNGGKREKEVINYLSKKKYITAFLDGTHENYDLLNKCRKTVWKGGAVRRVKGNLLNLMRGQIYRIEGKNIFTLGGGESPDKEIRQESNMWWPEEMPSSEELQTSAQNLDMAGRKVNYILTHEPPQLIKQSILSQSHLENKFSKLNGFLQEIANGVEFDHWYFGAMHEDKQILKKYTCVFKEYIELE